MSKNPTNNRIPSELPKSWETERQKRVHSVTCSKSSPGRAAYLKYLNGLKIGRREAMAAQCAECMGRYADGKLDCECYLCPLYPWMPYRGKKGKDDETRED